MGRAVFSVACAVVVGAAGFVATVFASMVQGANQGPVMGVFFFGPLGSVVGFVAAERAVRTYDGVGGRAVGRMVLVALGYGVLVFGAMLVMPR